MATTLTMTEATFHSKMTTVGLDIINDKELPESYKNRASDMLQDIMRGKFYSAKIIFEALRNTYPK